MTYLRNLFARENIAPRRRYGQNFLIDLNLHEVILEAAELSRDDVVLEVGPGAGALTVRMAEAGASVVSVEIDPAMARLTRKATGAFPRVQVLHQDALANKNTIAPEVLAAVRSALANQPDDDAAPRTFKLVANLPYNIATPLISNLLVEPDLRPERLIATIQLELAQRMLSAPSSPEYGALAVLVQALTETEILRVLSPKVFWPRPQVESAILRMIPRADKRAKVGDVPWFHRVIRQIFLHRRKNLRRVLHGFHRDTLSKPEIDAMLASIGLVGEVRAEAMTVDQHIVLAQAFRALLSGCDDHPASEVEEEHDAEDHGEDLSCQARRPLDVGRQPG